MNCAQPQGMLSVIMPALNEELNIAQAIHDTFEAIDFFKINAEVIVVNDGSVDRTQSIIEEKITQYPIRLKVIRHVSPQGIGASFWDGVKHSAGDIVVLMPGDNEVLPKEILRYYSLLEHVDIVVPFVFNREIRSFLRKIVSSFFVSIINATFNVNFTYTNGTVIYRKSALKEISYRCSGFFYQTDILVRLAKRGFLFAQVPYKLGIRAGGGSTALTLRSLRKVIRGYLRLVRDIYFNKNESMQNVQFPEDSLTAKRRKELKLT